MQADDVASGVKFIEADVIVMQFGSGGLVRIGVAGQNVDPEPLQNLNESQADFTGADDADLSKISKPRKPLIEKLLSRTRL